MTIAIFGSPFQEHFTKYIQHLIKRLETEHVKLIVEIKFYRFLQKHVRFNKDVNTFTNYKHLKENV